MDSAKTQLADRLKSANNILVTVSRDPSVDQLAACLGLTLLLNKLNKHCVAVFSGQVPSTIEFLKPQETLEKTTDSLRDFIIALDKDKADKLRYKVEDNVVRIFITPYKTSISEDDLAFSQGDFNVDVVVALGVKQQEDLDQAITAHGRILHDATLASINLSPDAGLGTINWQDPQASSLSELVTDLGQLLGDNILDNQIATALLTGIVAATNRFSNDKTSSQTMNASSALMAAGADQQLVATKLEEPAKPKSAGKQGSSKTDDNSGGKAKPDGGTLNISHGKDGEEKAKKPDSDKNKGGAKPAINNQLPPPKPQFTPPPVGPTTPQPPKSSMRPGAKLVTEPPSMGGSLTANSRPEGLDPVTDPFSVPQSEPSQLMSHTAPAPAAKPQFTPPPPAFTPPVATPPAPSPMPSAPPADPQTLTQIEQSVHSPHVDAKQLDTARDEVNQALQDSVDPTPAPIQALNAQPMGGELHPDGSPVMPKPPEASPQVTDSLAPPPVAPPLTQEAIRNASSPTPPNQPPPAL